MASFFDGTSICQLPEGAAAYTVGKDGDNNVVFYRIGEDGNVIPAVSMKNATLSRLEAQKVTEGTDTAL